MVLATAFILALGTLNDLDPVIRWHFPSRGCRPCVDKQLELMETFFRSGDEIIIMAISGEKKGLGKLRRELVQKFPGTTITVRSSSTFPGVGWTFEDPHGGERITFAALKGGYNSWRARRLLGLVR